MTRSQNAEWKDRDTHTQKRRRGHGVYWLCVQHNSESPKHVPAEMSLWFLHGHWWRLHTVKLGRLISIQTDPPNSHREITLDTCQSSLLPMPHANPHSPCKAGLKGEGREKRNSSDFRNEKAVRPEPLTGQNRTCKRDDPQGFTYVGHPGTGRRNAKPSYRPSAPGWAATGASWTWCLKEKDSSSSEWGQKNNTHMK